MAQEIADQPTAWGIRSLNNLELYAEARYLCGQYRCNAVTCRLGISQDFFSPAGTEVFRANFLRAVHAVTFEHGILRATLRENLALQSYWAAANDVNLSDHVEWLNYSVHAEDYEVILHSHREKLVDTEFTDTETQPGWRVTILSSQEVGVLDIIFTYTHTIADGKGGLVFIKSLLKHLQRDHPLPSNEILLLPPSPHQLCDFPLTPGFVLSTLWKELRPDIFRFSQNSHVGWLPTSAKALPTRLKSFSIESHSLEYILRCCRQNSTTLTGLVHALVFKSLITLLSIDQARAMTAVTTIDLRRFMPKNASNFPDFDPANTMGNFSSGMEHPFDENLVRQLRELAKDPETNGLEQAIWSIARRIRLEIEQKLSQGLSNDITGLMKFVSDWRAEASKKTARPREHSWLISNLGVLSADGSESMTGGEGPHWHLQDATFSLSSEAVGAPFRISLLTVRGKALNIEISWQDGTPKEMAERILEDIQTFLLGLAAHEGVDVKTSA
ncbi:unnamed protein product [Clonostachys byssicola]|uniref:Alcohol acetyltransferase FCK4 n=1 Tax=Clonostachys byssicola TaxID=160290 RepID=A0A9N9UUG5_9HYPO|nr:unnamed protein product [Clonostachys byssicola]